MTSPYCSRLRKRFDDYHDGELSAFLFEVIDRHLKTCAECREEYRMLAASIQVLRRLRPPAVPPRALRKVFDSLTNPPGGTPFPGRIQGPDLEQGLQAP